MKLLLLVLTASGFVVFIHGNQSTTLSYEETTMESEWSTSSTVSNENSTTVGTQSTTWSTMTPDETTTTEGNLPTTKQSIAWSTMTPVESTTSDSDEQDIKLSQLIRDVIVTYKEQGTVVIPGIDIPDPTVLPDKDFLVGPSPATFYNMTAHGLSDFTVDHINTNLNKMQVYVAVHMKRMVILGNYTINAFFMNSKGPFNVTLFNVETSGAVALKRDENGCLYANDSQMDMTFKDALVDFKNVGMLGHLFQAALGTVAPVLFERIKPSLINEINSKVRNDVNKKMRVIGEKLLSNKTEQPLEIALDEARNYVRDKGYDPYNIRDYVIRHNIFVANISHFVLYGLSDFHRVGDIHLSMDKGTVHMGIHVVSFSVRGKCMWTVSIGKTWNRSGYTNFTVDHLQIRIYINQSLDITQHPVLEDLDLNVGKVKIQMEGTGYFDALIVLGVNTLPDLIRHIIVDAIEEPLKVKVQDILNRVDINDLLEKGLPQLDNLGL